MEILSRNTKKVGNKYYISHRDKYYKNGDKFYESNTTFNNAESNAGDIHLVDKNIFSYGIRKDNNSNKLFGLRPDDTQDGSKQIEFSINNIKYNGEDYTLNLTDSTVNNNEIDIGDIKFSNYPGAFKQLYKAVDVNDFVITLDLDLTGYSIKNSKYTEEKTIKDTISCEVHNMGENTANYHFNNSPSYLSTYISDTNEKKLNFLIAKINDKSIMTGEYAKEDEFTDPSLNGYSVHKAPHNSNIEAAFGGSSYMKDTILMYCKGQNIDEEYFEDIILNNICDKYNLTLLRAETEDDNGEYFLYNNKKVGAWYVLEDNVFIMYINTKAIPDDVKSLFKRKTFENTSYLDLDLDTITEDFKNQFNYNMVKLEVGENHYINEEGVYTIQDSDGRWINLNTPYVLDDNNNPIEVICGHSLEQISENKYRYKKFIYPECSMLLKMKGTCYIDPTVAVDSKRFDNKKSSSSGWNTVRRSSTYSTAHSAGLLCQTQRTTSLGGQGSPSTTSYSIVRSSYRWDTSSVSGQTSGTLSADFRGDGSNMYAVLDERAKSSVYMFSDFSCYASDGSWDETNYTSGSSPGTSELYINNQVGVNNTTTGGTAHTFTLASGAITQINNNNEIDMMFMHAKDLENSTPSNNTTNYIGRGQSSGDWYGGDFNLILSEDSDDAAVVYNATFFGANF